MLFVDPQCSFDKIKKDLLAALKKTASLDRLDGEEILSDSKLVEFAVPADRHNPSKGWTPVEIPEEKMKVKMGRKMVANDSPEGAGLKDGSMLAFRFRKEGEDVEMDEVEWKVELPVLPEYEPSQPVRKRPEKDEEMDDRPTRSTKR